MTTNNTLVHKFLVPLIENIDFDNCENNSNIKAVISKLMTIAKNTMKNQQEPGDTSGIKIDEMKGALILDTQADKPKKDTEQSDEHDSESSDDSTGSSTKKQHIEKKSIKTPGKVDDESDINEDIDITINSDIDDPASDEE